MSTRPAKERAKMAIESKKRCGLVVLLMNACTDYKDKLSQH